MNATSYFVNEKWCRGVVRRKIRELLLLLWLTRFVLLFVWLSGDVAVNSGFTTAEIGCSGSVGLPFGFWGGDWFEFKLPPFPDVLVVLCCKNRPVYNYR